MTAIEAVAQGTYRAEVALAEIARDLGLITEAECQQDRDVAQLHHLARLSQPGPLVLPHLQEPQPAALAS